MARGGARSRSGPSKVEGSRTSERAGYVLTALPPAGYDGEVPEFPLPEPSGRELEVWSAAWRTPQACAWSSELWRIRSVAMWVRWSVRMEASDASAALGNVVMRYADDIGLTAAGLKLNGWKIADPKPVEDAPAAEDASVTDLAEWLSEGA